jgi:tetratricopeptide (TPR) repeat protein
VRDIAGNCRNILSDALEDGHCPPDLEMSINSIAYLNKCLRFSASGLNGSDLMGKAWPRVTQLSSTGKHGAFFHEMLMASSTMSTTVDVMECIGVGNAYFKEAVNDEKCKPSSGTSNTRIDHHLDQWYYSLAFLNYRRNDLRQALHWSEFAISQLQGNTSPTHSHLLSLTSLMLTLSGEAPRAIGLARKARQISELVGEIFAQSQAMRAESEAQSALGNLRCAEALSKAAVRLGPSELEEICKEQLAIIHLEKTEYQEAQELLLQVMDSRISRKSPINDTVFPQILLATIGIETGAELEDISRHIESARLQCNTFVMWPLGLIHCECLTAELHLLQGKISVAREFENCLQSYQQDAAGIQSVLTRLADIQYGINGHQETWRWAIILLAHGVATKRRGAIAKALRCIGDLLIEDDEDTSLSLFSAALDTFTFMDVHRDRADCMVRMAAIFDRRGEKIKAVDLLQKAHPLYGRSSQTQETAKIDLKVKSLTPILEKHQTRLQQLTELNVPAGDLGEARLGEFGEEKDEDVTSGHQAEGVLV